MERVQTFNNEIVCNHPKVIEIVPKTITVKYSVNKQSKRSPNEECRSSVHGVVYSLKSIRFNAKTALFLSLNKFNLPLYLVIYAKHSQIEGND